jgi:hypothetical protein
MFRNFISIKLLGTFTMADSKKRQNMQLWMQDKAQVDGKCFWNRWATVETVIHSIS